MKNETSNMTAPALNTGLADIFQAIAVMLKNGGAVPMNSAPVPMPAPAAPTPAAYKVPAVKTDEQGRRNDAPNNGAWPFPYIATTNDDRKAPMPAGLERERREPAPMSDADVRALKAKAKAIRAELAPFMTPKKPKGAPLTRATGDQVPAAPAAPAALARDQAALIATVNTDQAPKGKKAKSARSAVDSAADATQAVIDNLLALDVRLKDRTEGETIEIDFGKHSELFQKIMIRSLNKGMPARAAMNFAAKKAYKEKAVQY